VPGGDKTTPPWHFLPKAGFMFKNKSLQQGFTLIELMVVIVILAILLSTAIMSLKPNEAAELRQQTIAFKGVLISICDKSAFDQHIYALIPDKKGVSVKRLSKSEWQDVDLNGINSESSNWHEAIKVNWQLNEEIAKSNGLKKAGWMCWPSGEVSKGSISFKLNKLSNILEWDEILDFSLEEKDERQE